jgi:hypothetical protein
VTELDNIIHKYAAAICSLRYGLHRQALIRALIKHNIGIRDGYRFEGLLLAQNTHPIKLERGRYVRR